MPSARRCILQHLYENSVLNSSSQLFSLNKKGRDFAVGDIHGYFSALQTALDTVNFCPTVDRLFSVGDLVDRGPESHMVLDWLAKPWFHAICGNHDFMTWRAALGNPYLEVDHQMHGGAWLIALEADEQQRIGHRLASLPLVIEVQTPNGLVGIVHADCPYEDWAVMPKANPSEMDIEHFLWSIERYKRQYTVPVRSLHALVHGHMTVPEMKILGNVHFIDTGGWSDRGHFTLLDLHTLKAHRGPGETLKPIVRLNYR
jgi:serine/threonine protein phosphatase 1